MGNQTTFDSIFREGLFAEQVVLVTGGAGGIGVHQEGSSAPGRRILVVLPHNKFVRCAYC